MPKTHYLKNATLRPDEWTIFFSLTNLKCTMEELFKAALLFWLPLMLVPTGAVFALSRKEGSRPIVGWAVALISSLMVMSSWLTVPESDSSAGGHLILAIIGPTILMALGCFLAIFSGRIPVQRLPVYAGPVGFISVLLGLAWLLMMHLDNPPIWRHEINPYWLVWWPTFLLSVLLLSSFVIGAMLMVGDNRRNEAGVMAFFSLLFFVGLILLLKIDGDLTDAAQMRAQLWLATADAVGTILGILFAIVTVALVVAQYERRLPAPGLVSAMNEEEKEMVQDILNNNLGGDQE
jgi:hypothetical protein